MLGGALAAGACIGLPPTPPQDSGPGLSSTSDTDDDATGTSGGADSATSMGTGISDTSSTDTGFGPVCGDGLIEGDEECDLGSNNGQGDSCTSACTANVCGDGYLGPGEACDDGNLNDGDQCTTQCGLATCGDGALQAGEECDQGAANSETGSCLPSCISASCGDLFIQEGVESCDGVNTGAATCTTEGFDGGVLTCADDCSSFDTSNCYSCGNGVIEVNEICDGTVFEGNVDCSDYAPMGTTVSGGSLQCASSCTVINSNGCTFCGDGMLEGAEECDGGNLGGQTCASVLGAGYGGMLTCSATCQLGTSGCCLANGQSCMNDGSCCSGTCSAMGMGMSTCQP